jgi:hypothetical protein
MQLIHGLLVSVHVLASAAWFGAMLYSLIVVHPRARSFFRNPGDFEEFIALLAAGARWKVLGGCILITLTGVLPLLLEAERRSTGGWWCLIAKTVLFALAVGLFCFTSWKLWPARVLASVDERPQFQRKFRLVSVILLTLVGSCLLLAVFGRRL